MKLAIKKNGKYLKAVKQQNNVKKFTLDESVYYNTSYMPSWEKEPTYHEDVVAFALLKAVLDAVKTANEPLSNITIEFYCKAKRKVATTDDERDD